MGKFSIGSKINTLDTKLKVDEDTFIKQAKTVSSRQGRGNYKRISFNLPPELISSLRNYSNSLKDAGKKDSGMSTVVTIACIEFLKNKGVDIDESIIVEKKIR